MDGDTECCGGACEVAVACEQRDLVVPRENDVEGVVRSDLVKEAVRIGQQRSEGRTILDEVGEIDERSRDRVPVDHAGIRHSAEASVGVGFEVRRHQHRAVLAQAPPDGIGSCAVQEEVDRR